MEEKSRDANVSRTNVGGTNVGGTNLGGRKVEKIYFILYLFSLLFNLDRGTISIGDSNVTLFKV